MIRLERLRVRNFERELEIKEPCLICGRGVFNLLVLLYFTLTLLAGPFNAFTTFPRDLDGFHVE